jgi:hypothetical protein
MKQNVGKTDATIRVLLGLVIILLSLYYKSLWGLVAIVPLATAYFGTCPLYSIIGINTCKRKKIGL